MLTTIDIGTNTMLMLIGEFDKSSSQIRTLFDTQRIPRLGKGVDAERNIPDESIKKASDILNEYKEISSRYGSKKIIAAATSFLRDAHNKYEFISKIKQDTGIEIEILSGFDEARWTFWGGIYEQVHNSNSKTKICTIDIGGGSTEITASKNLPDTIIRKTLLELPIESRSINIGSVRIKERFMPNHPPEPENIAEAVKFIENGLNEVNFDFSNTKAVGVAGTITTLAAVKMNLNDYDRNKIEGIELTIEDIDSIIGRFQKASLDEMYSLGSHMEGRTDVILPGTLILKSFMNKFGFGKIIVSVKGLRYGIFLREVIS